MIMKVGKSRMSVVASLVFVSLFVSLFILPTGYTYDETCPECKGEGTVICRDCSGDGICRSCGGDGEIFEDWWCAACHGSGKCSTCEGKGWHTCIECEGTGLLVHWMYNLIGATVVPSFISVLLFLGLFYFSYAVSAFYLSFNEWIYQVKHMDFWFNPSFMTWLFAKHYERWAKWTTGISSILSIYLGVLLFGLLSFRQVILETFVAGILLSIPVVASFSILFYKAYVSKLKASS